MTVDHRPLKSPECPVVSTFLLVRTGQSERIIVGTNSSEAAELSITCQGLSAGTLIKLYVEGLGKL